MTHMFLAQNGVGCQGGEGGGGIGSLLGSPLFVVVAFFFIMYFLLIRPKQKEQRTHQRMLDSVKKGDRVLTNGGIYGLVENVREKDGVLVVKIAEKVKVELARSAIARLVETGQRDE